MQPVDLIKQREIHLSRLPLEQAAQAARLLNHLPGLFASAVSQTHLVVQYQIPQWTLETIERHLCDAGFHLDVSLFEKLKRALVHYSEAIQVENLHHPEREYKTKEIYIHAWEHHPHGDHDDTPEELRKYR